jgi:short-subunit dehydrogenase
MRLNGRRVLITGASRGIGELLAKGCAAAGADVALVARSRDALEKVAFDVGGRAYVADLADPAQVGGLIARVEGDGPVDVLINNAALDNPALITELSDGDIEKVVQVNLAAPLELSRQVVPGMIRRGGGHIVNISSLGGCNAVPGLGIYSSTKAGLSHFTATLRGDLKGTPVRTTLVEIGPTQTEMWDRVTSQPAFARSIKRLRHLGVIHYLDPQLVAYRTVAAIEADRRHVRLPLRDIAFPLLAEAPRRLTEWLLVGVKVR